MSLPTSDIPNPAAAPWHPTQFMRRKANLDIRQRVIAAMRGYFAGADFAEVETPALQVSPGGEVHLQAFATELKGPRPGAAQKLYLHTSPEFAMKKLLVAGVPKLYQLAHVFRNGEHSPLHHPEFLMCEWYRAKEAGQESDPSPASDLLDQIMQDCVALVRAAAAAAKRKIFSMNGITCDPFRDWEMLSVAEAFRRHAAIDVLATAPDPNAPDEKLLAKEARRIGVHAGGGDAWDDLFFRIMGEKIEPHLGRDRPVFLCDYPASMAALARPKADDARVAERFELYMCGIELANGFFELTDAAEQARRLKADMALKEKLYFEAWPVDDDFIEALRFGMPESAGVALGADRLVMLCAGATRIEDVLWMPVQMAGDA